MEPYLIKLNMLDLTFNLTMENHHSHFLTPVLEQDNQNSKSNWVQYRC